MEMKLLEQLYRWRNKIWAQGEQPAFVPLSREEFTVTAWDSCPYTQTERFIANVPPKIFGIDTFETPFADEMRARQIDIPVTQVDESAEFSEYEEILSQDYNRRLVRYRLRAHICHDTTEIKLTFEWDVLAKFKRKFRLTKWFPIKTRTATIEGRVLYPYLKVTLPHNKHHVQFKHTK